MKPLSEDDPRKLLGDLLRQARTEAGLTQDAIGHAVSVERSGVTRMEGGERHLTPAALDAWLERCGVAGLAESSIRAMWRAARRHRDDDDPLKAWFVGWVDAEREAHLLRYWPWMPFPFLLRQGNSFPSLAQAPAESRPSFASSQVSTSQVPASFGSAMR